MRQLSLVGEAILATEGPANASVAGGVWRLERPVARAAWTALLDRRLLPRQPRLRALRRPVIPAFPAFPSSPSSVSACSCSCLSDLMDAH